MKKALVLSIVLLCALSVFASNDVISFKCTPMSTQISTSSDEPVYKIQSEFGIGAEVSYRRYLSDRAFISGGFVWNSFLLPDSRPCFTSLMPFAGLGAECHLCDIFKITVDAGLGLDCLIYDKTFSETFTIKTDVSFDFSINEKIELVLGCGGSFGFANKANVDYVNYRILPEIGMNIGL